MSKKLRIAVADDEIEMRDYFTTILPRMGHTVLVASSNGRELVEQCKIAKPDLVITDIKMPDMDGIEAVRLLYADRPVPVILVSAYHDPAFIERAEQGEVLAYLIKPIKRSDLETAIAIVIRRFSQFQGMLKETVELKQTLADRKIIEKAKGVLMKKGGFDENEAYRRLQKIASDKNKKLIEIAGSILMANEAFGLN